jgi:hypothetical protein
MAGYIIPGVGCLITSAGVAPLAGIPITTPGQMMFGSYWFLWTISIFGILASLSGLHFVRQKVSREMLIGHHDVALALLQVVGTLYAVVLGLVVMASLNKFEQARGDVEHEANALRNIYIYSLSCFDYPFSGDVRVWPVPFQTDLQVFQEESQRPPAPGQPEAVAPVDVRTDAAPAAVEHPH